MMLLRFTDREIQAKAEELGMVQAGQAIPTAAMRSRAAAALVEERRSQTPRPAAEPRMADEIVVQPSGPILIDGEPIPWIVTTEPMDIRLADDGSGTIRLTLAANAIQILKAEPTKEEQS